MGQRFSVYNVSPDKTTIDEYVTSMGARNVFVSKKMNDEEDDIISWSNRKNDSMNMVNIKNVNYKNARGRMTSTENNPLEIVVEEKYFQKNFEMTFKEIERTNHDEYLENVEMKPREHPEMVKVGRRSIRYEHPDHATQNKRQLRKQAKHLAKKYRSDQGRTNVPTQSGHEEKTQVVQIHSNVGKDSDLILLPIEERISQLKND